MNREKTTSTKKIKLLLMKNNVTQAEFAKICHCTPITINRYLNADQCPYIIKEKAEELFKVKIREVNNRGNNEKRGGKNTRSNRGDVRK